MLFSGYNYRSVFEQTGLNFDLNLSINNTTGSGAFGFSGEGNQIQFTFQSGKIYDFENRYVNSYIPNTNTRILGDLENGNYSYYINNTPVCFNGIKNDFKVQRFFYTASGCQIDSSLVLKGANEPLFSFNFPSNFKIGKTYTGQIGNDVNNLAFKIFSGELSPTGNFSINSIDTLVSGLKTGNIKINTVNEVGGYNLTLNLYTNFGLITKNFDFTGLFELENIISLFINPDNLSIISGTRNSLTSNFGELNYSNEIFSGNTILTGFNNLPLTIKFEYYSGQTGEFTDNIIGSGYGYNLSGSGIITNGTQIFNFTGLSAISGINYTGGLYTGLFPATGAGLVTATGIFNYNIVYPGTGFFTGMAVGTFGLPYYYQYFTGGINLQALNPNTPGTGALTGFNTTWFTGYVSGTGFLFSGIVTGADYLYLTNTRSGLATGLLSGEITQYLETGIITFSPGSRSRIFKIVTGGFQIVNSGLSINLGYSGLVFNKDNLYGSYQNRNDLGLYDVGAQNWNTATINNNPGLLSGFDPIKIERKGLVIFNTGNPNDFITNPTIFNISTGEVNKVITYPNINLTFVIGQFDFINDTTGRWGGFLLTGNNFQLTGWNPSIRYNASAYDAYLNDIFLTGDNIYIGGLFDSVNLDNNFSCLTRIKINNDYLTNPSSLTKFTFDNDNQIINKLTNFDDKLYIFGTFNNFLNSGNYTNRSLWANTRNKTSTSTDGYYNKLLIIDPNTSKAIPDPYDAYLLDYLGITGYNQFNFDSSIETNTTVYNTLKTTGNKNYIVGNFRAVGATRRVGIVAYDENENLLAYNPEIESSADTIYFMFESGNNLFVGGGMQGFGGIKYDNAQDVNGSYQNYGLVKLINPFTIDRSFTPIRFSNSDTSNGQIYDINFYNNNIYTVGNFDSVINKTGIYSDSSTWISRPNCAIFNQSGDLFTGNYEFDDYVKTIYITGFTGFFGGNFTQVATNSTAATSRNRFAAINLNTHEILAITGNFDGVVNQIGHYTGNQILVVGDFDNIETDAIPTTTTVNGITFLDTKPTPSQNAQLILNRTTSQSSFNNFEGFTKFISNNATGFYLYGALDNDIYINDITATSLGVSMYNNKIIQLNITGGLATGFRPDINNTVYTAFVTGDRVIVGGDFSTINNTGVNNIAMLTSGSGILLTNYTGFNLNSTVRNIIEYNDSLITVGDFTTYSGNKNADRFLYHHKSGDTVYNSLKFNTDIYKIKNNNGSLFVGGNSALFPAQVESRNGVLGLISLNNSSTGYTIPDNNFNKNLPYFNEAIRCFATGNSGIYVGGEFTTVNDQPRTGLALIDYNGNLLDWRPRIAGGNRIIKSILATGNRIFIGGDFNTINGLNIPSLCKLRTDTNGSSSSDVDVTFLPILDEGVEISALYLDQNLYIGGDFVSINNLAYKGFAELNPSNGISIINSVLFSDPNPVVNTIAKTGNVFLIGGQFEYQVGNNLVQNFLPIRLNGTISNHSTGLFSDADTTKSINSIAIGKNNKIYLCGNLSTNDNANYNLGGATSLTFDSGSNTFTWDNWTPFVQNENPQYIYQSQMTNNIFILNRFDLAGHLRQGICEINNSGKLNLRFNPKVNILNAEYIKDSTQFNETGIAVGGNFTKIGEITGYKNFAIINNQNNTSNNFNINFSNPVQSLYRTGDNLYIGGNFISISGNNNHEYFSNFVGFSTGNMDTVNNNISFIQNIDGISGGINIDINSINNLNNKFLVGGNFKNLNPYLIISGSGAFVSGINYINTILTGTGNLTLNNSSGIFRNNLNYSGINYSSSYNFSYINNQNATINSSLNRNINEILTTSLYTEFTGTKLFIETGSGIITGIQTLIKDTGLWYVTGKFTGILSGSIYSNAYIYSEGLQATGLLIDSGYAITNISGDPFVSNQYFTGTIQVSQAYAVSSYTGIQPSGTYFSCDTSNFYVTGINVTGSRVISGFYSGLSSGLILQTNPQGNVLATQARFITSGGYEYVTGALGITYNFSPEVFATGIFSFSTGNILTTGYLTGIPQYVKDFTGVFKILTGIFDTGTSSTTYSSLSVYNNIYTGYHLYDTGTLFGFRFDYIPYIDYKPIIGKLTLSGSGNAFYTGLITGV